MLPYEEEVRAGMAFLDEDQPGWELKLDFEKLDLSSSCTCVLGQLEGDFLDATYKFGWKNAGSDMCSEVYRFGFLLDHQGVTFETLNDGYEELTETWITLTKERLDAGIDLA